MNIEFDPDKDAINRAKHGVPLEVGRIVLENVVADIIDPREYATECGAEERRIAYGLVAGRLLSCAYTMRGDVHRLISTRKANSRERKKWLPE